MRVLTRTQHPTIADRLFKLTKDRKVFIPPMDPFATELLAANFRGFGYEAEVMRDDGAWRCGEWAATNGVAST